MTGLRADTFFAHSELLQRLIGEVRDRLPSVGLIQNINAQLERISISTQQLVSRDYLRNVNNELLNSLRAITNRGLTPDETTLTVPDQQVNRTFFTHRDPTLASTQALLSHRPPGNYGVHQTSIPPEELYGLLLRLHANLVEWLMHLDTNIQTTARTTEIRGIDEHATRNLQILDNKLDKLLDQLTRIANPASPAPTDLSSLSDDIRAIKLELSRTTAEGTLQKLIDALAKLPPSKGTETQVSETPAQLPPYAAKHPETTCRTHGVLVFDDIHTRIPMDLLGRPASTNLQLSFRVTQSESETELKFTIYNAGSLLLSRNITTPTMLQNLPGDALSLIHEHCPNFVYKLSRSGVC